MSIPYPTEPVADLLGVSPVELVERFGDVVLVEQRLGSIVLRAGPPAPTERRARAGAIIAAARTDPTER
jgi:hypothetical protein